MGHKSGYVSIVGNANVGKSTLMNRLVGEPLSIVTAKSQTTRHRIIGINDTKEYQIVYSDTPGVLSPLYGLQRAMLSTVESTFEDTDVFLYITDVVEQRTKHAAFIERLRQSKLPVIVVINKIDLTNQSALEKLVAFWSQALPSSRVLPLSALHGFGIEQVEPALVELLPEGEKYFPEGTLTDRPMRFFIGELIRAQVVLHCREEIPYSVEVEVRDYEEGNRLDRIEAVIYVARDSQKGIIIGKGGKMLRRLGESARYAIEEFLEKQVYLHLRVEVLANWRDSESHLRRFGYLG